MVEFETYIYFYNNVKNDEYEIIINLLFDIGDLPSCCKKNNVPHTCFGLCVVKEKSDTSKVASNINHLAGTCKDFLDVINKCHETGKF